jgi:hypothetical protein
LGNIYASEAMFSGENQSANSGKCDFREKGRTFCSKKSAKFLRESIAHGSTLNVIPKTLTAVITAADIRTAGAFTTAKKNRASMQSRNCQVKASGTLDVFLPEMSEIDFDFRLYRYMRQIEIRLTNLIIVSRIAQEKITNL